MTGESLPLPTTPFDALAAGYDASFTTSRLGSWLRSAVWKQMDASFANCSRVLDIGCGTGEDAIHFASRGLHVVATDASTEMLEVARDKAIRAGCADKIVFRRASMPQLDAELSGEIFDGVYSNFGAVNCTSELDKLIEVTGSMTTPGAPLVWVVMGRHVPWEWIWFLARAKPRKAFRRLKRAGASWRGLRITYPTPRELSLALSARFKPIRRRALGLFLPPSFAADWLERSPGIFSTLARLESTAARWQALAALADHYIIEAHRLPNGAAR